jgi:poly(A) polymerase
VTRRLRLSNDEGERVVWLVENQQSLADAPQLPLAKLKRVLAHPLSGELVKFVRADIGARRGDSSALEFVKRFLNETPAEVIDPPPLVTGADLIEVGLQPGPAFQSLLERIRDEQLEGRVRSKDEAIAVVRTWL